MSENFVVGVVYLCSLVIMLAYTRYVTGTWEQASTAKFPLPLLACSHPLVLYPFMGSTLEPPLELTLDDKIIFYLAAIIPFANTVFLMVSVVLYVLHKEKAKFKLIKSN